MAVTTNFVASSLDLNGKIAIVQPTAVSWGPDGRLYVTEVRGDVKVLTVAFGDKDPTDTDFRQVFYVTEARSIIDVANIPNRNDDGTTSANTTVRQVTGVETTKQYNAAGEQMFFDGKPAVTMYVSSSDSRVGAGGNGNDANLDTNSGVITKFVQTGADSWQAIDIVRGLPRSEENHATNGIEVIQTLDAEGRLVSERMLVASGGNANAGAPSNNFAGQAEYALAGAILEIDLDVINALPVRTSAEGRQIVYDLPTLDDVSQVGATDRADPFGGNDGFNQAIFSATSPVQMYSPGYRNSYDVLVTEDGRVFTYDNGANNSWGGRPIGEAGVVPNTNGVVDRAQFLGYIATNLNNGDGNANDPINLSVWDPSNRDQLHEITRSDDLANRTLSAGQGGPQTYQWVDGLTYVYGGHPNPTRAEGTRAGLLFTPKSGAKDSFLLVSDQDTFGNGGGSDYAEVVAWLTAVEANDTAFPDVFNSSGQRIAGAGAGDLTKKVLALTPGLLYDIYVFADGSGAALPVGSSTPAGGTLLGQAGLPANFASIVHALNPVEGNYLEAGRADGAIDSGFGSINGLAEYTSTVLDSGTTKMSGALIAASLEGGNLIVIGRDANGVVPTRIVSTYTQAADRAILDAGGAPLGLDAIGDNVEALSLSQAFRGSIWVATYEQNGPIIEVFQPNNGAVPVAGSESGDPMDRDGDGVDHVDDPFEFDADNGFVVRAGQSLVIDFDPQNTNFPTSVSGTGLLGAALDGDTPNRDAKDAREGFTPEQVQDGLYNIGFNVLPGGNAPILQIKDVTPGTVVGSANTARDVLHTGVRLGTDVAAVVATIDAKNWISTLEGGVQPGQLTGLIFGDGTQANFLRIVFGSVNGQAGIEVGYEIGDANYTVLARIATPELTSLDVTTLQLRLTLETRDAFAVSAAYRFEGDASFTTISLNGGAGFSLPPGVLQNVLTGAHVIDGATGPQASGAAFGFLTETTSAAPLRAIDFDGLVIEAVGTAPDSNAPNIVSISVNNPPSVQDGVRLATVVLSDTAGFSLAQFSSLDGSELTFDGIVPAAVSAPTVSFSDANRTATLTYVLTPPGGSWPTGVGNVTVAPGAYRDAAGNSTAGESTNFLLEPNLSNLTRANVAFAVNVGPSVSSVVGGVTTFGGAITNDRVIGVDLVADNALNYSAEGGTTTGFDGAAGDLLENPSLDGSALHSFRAGATGGFVANYPIVNGVYIVDFWFADVTSNSSGQRRGDYLVNGETLALDFDPFASAGPNEPLRVTKTVVVLDGKITVEATADAGLPALSAVVAYQAALNFTPPGVSVSDLSAVEGSSANVVFTRTGDVTEAVTISYALVAGTASSEDYGGPLTGVVTIPAGASGVSLSIPLLADGVSEDLETFSVVISDLANRSGNAVIVDGAGTVTIEPPAGPRLHDELLDGDLSGNRLAPTDLGTLTRGDNVLVVTQQGLTQPGGVDRDYFTVTIPVGMALHSIILDDYETSTTGRDQSFISVQAGRSINVDPETFENSGELLGGLVYNDGFTGNDLLPDLAAGETFGFQFFGFDAPLGAGVYTFWMNQTDAPALSRLRLVVDEEPGLKINGVSRTVASFDNARTFDRQDFGDYTLGQNRGAIIENANAWKQVSFDYTITANTILSFDFSSDNVGEIHAIGLETDNLATQNRFFKVFGTQVWGNQAFNGRYTEGAAPLRYDIRVADYIAAGQTLNRLVFATDDDAGNDASSIFANVWLREGAPIRITNAISVTEGGNTGASTLVYGLTGTAGAELDLAYTVNGVARTERIEFDGGGRGQLTVNVANDAVDNGNDTIAVRLTSTGSSVYTIDASAATAIGVVVEDDVRALRINGAPVTVETFDGNRTVDRNDFGDFGVSPDGRSLTLDSNSWKQARVNYTITPDTVLSFSFSSDNVGEIHAVGLETDDLPTQSRFFKVFGTQAWGISAFNGLYTQGAAPVRYDIRVADFIAAGQSMNRLVFSADDDAQNSASSVFADVWLRERAPIGIADAPSVFESDDTGTTEVAFSLTGTAGAVVDLGYTVNGVARTSRVSFDATGRATLLVPVANDAVNNGNDTISLRLTNVAQQAYQLDPGKLQATGLVVEDDQSPSIEVNGVRLDIETFDSYKSNDRQDFGEFTTSVDGRSIIQAPNSWEQVRFSYTVTADTVLSFEFSSSQQGEVHAIGLESDDSATQRRFFKVFGTQAWGNSSFNGLYNEGAEPVRYDIRLAEFLGVGASFDRLVFANDDDAGNRGTSVFSNVTVRDVPRIGFTGSPSAVEAGDSGFTTLLFALTGPANTPVSVSFTQNGVARTQNVVFDAAGSATIPVLVVNDGINNGNENVELRLTGVLPAAYQIDPARASVTGTVTEDDASALLINGVAATVVSFDDYRTSGRNDFGDYVLSPDGRSIVQDSNSWEKTLRSGVVTADTVLSFTFSSDNAGEIHAIGLESDDSATQARFFKVLGTQTWGISAFNGLYTESSAPLRFDIRVADYIAIGTSYSRLVFATDDDAQNDAASVFSDIWLRDRTPIEITNAPEMVETGDIGSTALTFGLTGTAGAVVDLSFTVDGQAQTRKVSFDAAGRADLVIEAANDNVADGDDTVTVTLTGVAQTAYTLSATGRTAVGRVTDDETPEPTVAEIFAAIGAQTPDAAMPGAVGAALLRITPDSSNVQISNFAANSMQISNLGDKRIAAVFLDVRDALYGDSVFDDDGSGGDQVFKALTLNSGATITGAVQPSEYQEYWFPAHDLNNLDPLFDDVGNSGRGSDGGFRGLALAFSPTSSGGFQPGETLGFSADMDPNSVAGFLDSTINTGAVPSPFDAGGISGAELIGSQVTVLFTDGTVASGQLMGDGSQGGAQAFLSQGLVPQTATVTVDGLSSGSVGSYGGNAPTVVVSGPSGALVRVVMTVGVQPVRNATANAATIVDARLEDYAFKANNAVEFQTFDIQLGPSQTSQDVSGLFDFSGTPNGWSFDGDDMLPLGFVAAVIDPVTLRPLGPVTAPIYLENNGSPVVELF